MNIHHALLDDKPLIFEAKHPSQIERPAHVQSAIACAVRAFLIERLTLFESHAEQVKTAYSLPASLSYGLGYRSAPEPLRFRVYQVDGHDASHDELQAHARQRHAWLDEMSDDEFFDFLTYSKEPIPLPLADLRTRAELVTVHQDLIEHELAQSFGDVRGVAGPYMSDRLRAKFPRGGLLVPCRGAGGLIVNLQCYPKAGERKFFWFSSSAHGEILPGGAAARQTLHIANERRASSGICIVARHTVEADAISWAESSCTVAVNGLNPLRFARDLRAALPDVRGVVLAFTDSFLERTLRENGLRVQTVEIGGQSDF